MGKVRLPSRGSLPRLIPPKIMLSKHPSQSSIDGRPSPGISSLGWFAARCGTGHLVELRGIISFGLLASRDIKGSKFKVKKWNINYQSMFRHFKQVIGIFTVSPSDAGPTS